MTKYLAWIDIETTGLDHEEDHLLEVYCQLTRFDGSLLGNPFHGLAPLPDGWDLRHPELWPVDPSVMAMHNDSGLWADVSQRGRRHEMTPSEDDLVDWFLIWLDMAVTALGPDATVHPAGSGVSRFDVPWLKARMACDAHWPLHYRELDMSPIRLIFQACGWTIEQPGTPTHRAEKDVHRAIDDYQSVRYLLGKAMPQCAGEA